MIKGEEIRSDQIVFLQDTQSATSIKKAVVDNPKIKAVIGDNASLWNFDTDVQTYTLPFFFVSTLYRAKFHLCEYQERYPTECVFNFCINGRTIPRYLTLRAVEFFKLSNYRYTYSGSCNNIRDEYILQEINLLDPTEERFTKELVSQILGPVTIPPNFVGIDTPCSQIITEHGAVFDYGGDIFPWISGLDRIFQSSLISLITESCAEDYDLSSVFTEKTFYSILGLTMPLWVGGFRNAEQFRKMGFDVFEDLIDHSYQYEKTVFLRCLKAIEDNIDLLRISINQAHNLRQRMLPRLQKNRDYLMSQQFIEWFREQMHDWPETVRSIVLKHHPIIDHVVESKP